MTRLPSRQELYRLVREALARRGLLKWAQTPEAVLAVCEVIEELFEKEQP